MTEQDEPPEDVLEWLRAGIRRPDAESWRRWGFTLKQATAWIRAGVTKGLSAAQWRTAGVSPSTVPRWRDAGIDAAAAVHWHELGFTLEQAEEHLAHGRGPDAAFRHGQGVVRPMALRSTSVRSSRGTGSWRIEVPSDVREFLEAGVRDELIRGYLLARWLDTGAVTWARAGIEAHDARLWAALGVTTAEATELAREGIDPLRIIREWWLAGIPFEEVGVWLGAGFTAAEATTQRANGVTVEQAAVLRALRRK